jgi:hypothetical protein
VAEARKSLSERAAGARRVPWFIILPLAFL